jgi:hypothetical protein
MWRTDLVLMLRSLIGDLDRAKFTDERLRQIIVVGAFNVINDADFANNYTVDVGAVTISPDPVTQKDTDFTILTLYKAAADLMKALPWFRQTTLESFRLCHLI